MIGKLEVYLGDHTKQYGLCMGRIGKNKWRYAFNCTIQHKEDGVKFLIEEGLYLMKKGSKSHALITLTIPDPFDILSD